MKNSKKLTLSIVIPAYNEERYIKACLDSIAKQTTKPDKVIVVDNNSIDKTASIAKKYSFVEIVREEKQGIVFARNAGFEASNTDLIGRIDADTHLAPDWVANTKDFFSSQPQIAAVTGSNYFYDFPLRRLVHALHTFTYYILQKWIAGTDILWASNMVITRDAWIKVENSCSSETKFFVHEDVDLSLQLKRAGLRVERTKMLRAEVSMRRGDLRIKSLFRYLIAWHRTYLINRYYFRALLIMILELLTVLAAIVSKPVVVFTRLKPIE